MKHLLSIADLERADIERILERAESFAEVGRRDIKKVPTLRGRTIVTLFMEASTRTSSSFELAAKRLSADVVSVKASGSSVEKGESLKDTIATLSAYGPDGLGEADVVYALRMQRERMRESFVPSIREYAASYQIDGRPLGARQLLMHPGPVNRGIELAPEVIDGPSSLIAEQVEAGLYVRMAILYELLAGRDRPGGARATAELEAPTPIGEPA